jgi:hypothetical protein
MSYAPLVVFVYNRKDKAEIVLNALNQNYLASETDLYIFSDAYNPKKENDENKVNSVREYLEEFKTKSVFKKIEIINAVEHQGLATSVINGVTKVINQYGNIIVTEDDLVAHKNYLKYMNEALDYYKDNEHIWSISGYTYALESNKNESNVYFTYRGSSWGYATWKDRWDTVDWSMKDFNTLVFHHSRMHNLNLAGRDMWFMLRNQKKGVIDSWAVRWVFEQTRRKKLTVYPAQTLLHSIGMDGSGTHHDATGLDKYSSLEDVPYTLRPIVLESNKLNDFSKHYKDPVFKMIQKY